MYSKEKYETPEAEIIAFTDNDVITASSIDTMTPRYGSSGVGSSPLQLF